MEKYNKNLENIRIEKYSLRKLMAFNEKLNKVMEEIQKEKLFNYANVFGINGECNKHIILFQIKSKALSMEEKDTNLWWDVI